jgi:hypothetical protein
MIYNPTIYHNNTDNSCRYALGTEGEKPLIVIGINPSTANDSLPDRTIKKVMGFANGNGFDSFIMLNLYPQRTPYPHELHVEEDEKLTRENLNYISSIVSSYDQPTILVAWSEKIVVRKYLKKCLLSIVETVGKDKATWIKLGELTNSGHPRHPLYAPYHLALTDFHIDDYIAGRK